MLQSVVKNAEARDAGAAVGAGAVGAGAEGAGAKESEAPCTWIPLTKSGGTSGLAKVYLLDRSDTDPSAVRYKVYYSTNLTTDLLYWGVKVVIFDNCNEKNRGPIDDCAQFDIKTIAVSSLQMRFDDSFGRQQAYTVNGWKETEYCEACEDNDFYDSVMETLKMEDFSEEELNDLDMKGEVVASKYHIAGGCARWMFQYSSEELLSPAGAMESIDNHLDRVSLTDISPPASTATVASPR